MGKIRNKQPDADAGRVIVDEQLEDLEARLTSMYAQTAKEVQNDLDKFLAKYKKQDAEKQAMVEADEMTKDEYIDWRNRQIFRTNAMQAKIDDVTARMVNADKQAMAMVNDQLPETYSTSYNFGGYRAEAMSHEAGFDYTQFTIINQEAVKELMTKDPDLIPWKSDPDIDEDKKWNRQHVQEAVRQGIVKGDSMDDIAKRLLPVVNMDKNAAIRTARTAVNGIENKGRKDATERVKAVGIPMIEMWSCTHDDRTRDTHILLDKTYPNEKGLFGEGIISKLLEYPGDPNGDPEEVYNCRCGLLSTIKGIDHSKDDELYAKMMQEEYYEDWLQVKEKQDEKEVAFQTKKEGAAERVAEKQAREEAKEKEDKKSLEEIERSNAKNAPSADDVLDPNRYFHDTTVEVTENLVDWVNEVNAKGIPAIAQHYMDDSSINTALRDEKELTSREKSQVKQMDRFIETSSVEEGTVLYSGLTSSESVAIWTNSDVIEYSAFLSTSPDPIYARGYALNTDVMLEIHVESEYLNIGKVYYQDSCGCEGILPRNIELTKIGESTELINGEEVRILKFSIGEEERVAEKQSEIEWGGHKGQINNKTQEIEKIMDIDEKEARRVRSAIERYSDGDFQLIRQAQQGNNDEYKKEADRIEAYIEKAPKWDGGQITRGLSFSNPSTVDTIIQKVEDGEPIEMLGMTSWSSNKDVALNFADAEISSRTSVIFVNEDEKCDCATSIQYLSLMPYQDEVLVSGNADFQPARYEQKDGVTYIYGHIRRKNDG